jgi:hypothetical protein
VPATIPENPPTQSSTSAQPLVGLVKVDSAKRHRATAASGDAALDFGFPGLPEIAKL